MRITDTCKAKKRFYIYDNAITANTCDFLCFIKGNYKHGLADNIENICDKARADEIIKILSEEHVALMALRIAMRSYIGNEKINQNELTEKIAMLNDLEQIILYKQDAVKASFC